MKSDTRVPMLPSRLLRRAKVVANRNEILPNLPKSAVICEVGVAYGDFTKPMLELCKPRKFIAIDIFTIEQYPDMWGFDRLNGGSHYDFYTSRFRREIAAGLMDVKKGYSRNALREIDDKSVDVFYVDAWHSYEAVKEELAIIKHKIVDGGWIIFNDYVLIDAYTGTEYGVIPAANEFMISEQYEMLYFALHQHMFCDVAIRKAPSD